MLTVYILLALTVILDIVGQVFFKLGVGHDDGTVPPGVVQRSRLVVFLQSLLQSPWIVAGVVVYVGEFIVWFAALSRAPLSMAFPFNALAYCGVVLASRYILHESVSPRRWLGTLTIAVGVLLVCLP